jgi:uncharacterized membrane protein YdfJ with MMPL/SSD domain
MHDGSMYDLMIAAVASLCLIFMIMLAVGSDYNLLLVARFKEEIGAGLNTGMIRPWEAQAASSPPPGSCSRSRWARW